MHAKLALLALSGLLFIPAGARVSAAGESGGPGSAAAADAGDKSVTKGRKSPPAAQSVRGGRGRPPVARRAGRAARPRQDAFVPPPSGGLAPGPGTVGGTQPADEVLPGRFAAPAAAAPGPGQPGALATGGLTGESDGRLIHGFDGDGVDELAPTTGDGAHPRVSRVHGGSYVEGMGIPARKGEPVHGGNYIPGLGVTGRTSDPTAGGLYTPGYGVVGSFDPRLSNQSRDRVAGGTLVPGFGVIPDGTPFGPGAGFPSYYGSSSLPMTYGATGAGPIHGGAAAMPSYGAGIPSAYGAGSLPQAYGPAGGPNSGAGVMPAFPGTGFGAAIPPAYGAGSLPIGLGGHK